jgi:two-component SAPR family response regulator
MLKGFQAATGIVNAADEFFFYLLIHHHGEVAALTSIQFRIPESDSKQCWRYFVLSYEVFASGEDVGGVNLIHM